MGLARVIWVYLALGFYALVLLAISLISLRPFRTPIFLSPGFLGAPQEEFDLDSSDGVRLRAWAVDSPGARTVAVLCHGYVMNRVELTPVAYWLWRRGVSSLLFDFRAHGQSKGGVATIGWREREDVRAAVDEARRRWPGARVVVIGSSMGSAAAAFAAADGAPIDALVLDSCYSTLASASLGWWRFLGGRLLSWFLSPTLLIAGALARMNPLRVDVGRALAKARCPVLILHGRCDTLALPREAKRNLAALGDRAEIVWFDDCGHSEFRWTQSERYFAALEAFLVRLELLGPNPIDPIGVDG